MSHESTVTVTYRGVEMECSYEYDPGEPSTQMHPGWPENATLCKCKVGGVDILEMLSNRQRDEIECAILEACEGANMTVEVE